MSTEGGIRESEGQAGEKGESLTDALVAARLLLESALAAAAVGPDRVLADAVLWIAIVGRTALIDVVALNAVAL